MASKLRAVSDGGLMFWCGGCQDFHNVKTGEGEGPRWAFNGDTEAPTFTPGIRFAKDGVVCSAVITAGNAEYLAECTHAAAGQTVCLSDFPPEYED